MTMWPSVRLGEVLRRRSPDVCVEPMQTYQFAGVYCFGRGVFRGQERLGSAFAYKTLTRLRQGEFVYPKLMAWEGAFGIVPPNCDRCYVSPEFPVFELDTVRLLPRFLEFYFQIPAVWESVSGGSTGTNVRRRRLNPSDFLQRQIPLPPLAEQRRVVARTEELAAQIHEARTLRQQATEEAEALRIASLRDIMLKGKAEEIELEGVCDAIIDNLHSNPRYADSGVPCIRSPDVGWGELFLETALKTDEDEFRRRTVRGKPQIDDIVLVREGGGTGKCALVLPTHRFSLGQRVMMLRPNQQTILPQFFLYQLLSPLVQEDQIATLSKGSASPHLNIGALRHFRLRLPALAEQRRIVAELDALQAEVDALKRLQAETAAELDALLPAILDRAFKGEL